jgi:hypothetical protein
VADIPQFTLGNMLVKRTNYYRDLAADYSKPELIAQELASRLILNAKTYIALKEPKLPEITPAYDLHQIEAENRDWWPTHCEALRQGRGDLLSEEYRNELVYLCADGPFYGKDAGTSREQNWWALIAQPGVTMVWPIVLFHGEAVYFEWKCIDDETHEAIAKGNVTWLRRGHQGACHLKAEQLTFYRDVYAPPELLKLISRPQTAAVSVR